MIKIILNYYLFLFNISIFPHKNLITIKNKFFATTPFTHNYQYHYHSYNTSYNI